MMDFTTISEIINSHVTCAQALEDVCGVEVRKTNRNYDTVLCPNPKHNDTHYGSCIVSGDHVHCFACGFHESTIGVVEQVLNLNYIQAVKKIKEAYSLPIDLDTSEEEKPKETLRLDADKLALIGILDTQSLKKLYGENRTLFWDFIAECVEQTARAIICADADGLPEQVAESLVKRDESVAEFAKQLRAYREKNVPDTVLLIKQSRPETK